MISDPKNRLPNPAVIPNSQIILRSTLHMLFLAIVILICGLLVFFSSLMVINQVFIKTYLVGTFIGVLMLFLLVYISKYFTDPVQDEENHFKSWLNKITNTKCWN